MNFRVLCLDSWVKKFTGTTGINDYSDVDRRDKILTTLVGSGALSFASNSCWRRRRLKHSWTRYVRRLGVQTRRFAARTTAAAATLVVSSREINATAANTSVVIVVIVFVTPTAVSMPLFCKPNHIINNNNIYIVYIWYSKV